MFRGEAAKSSNYPSPTPLLGNVCEFLPKNNMTIVPNLPLFY